jgi:tetratricopeptide (TPR) repeat protein
MKRILWAMAVVMIAGVYACAPLHQASAQDAMAQGRLDDAGTEIQKAIADDPSNLQLKHLAAEIFTRRGTSYYKNGEMIAAEDDFRRAVDYEPTYAAAYDYLGLIAFSKHDWLNAINYGDKYAGISGEKAPLYVQQAREQERIVQAGGKSLLSSERRDRRKAPSQTGSNDF